MKNTRLSKFTHIADLFICSVWLLLVIHEYVRGWMNPNLFVVTGIENMDWLFNEAPKQTDYSTHAVVCTIGNSHVL